MHDPKNYYGILGLDSSSSQDDIKSAYRRLMKENHPDINPSEEAKEKAIQLNEAYEVLSDPQKRSEYDSEPNMGFGEGRMRDMFGDFFDFFQAHQWNSPQWGHQRQQVVQNSNQHISVDVDVNDLFDQNKKLTVTYKSRNYCQNCSKTGFTSSRQCSNCQGMGRITTQQSVGFYMMSQTIPCSECQGYGKIYSDACLVCEGFGTVSDVKQIDIDNIYRNYNVDLFYDKMGHKDNDLNAPPGNLYVRLNIVVPNGMIDNSYNVVISEPVNVLHLITENTIEVKGINNEVHSIKLKHDKHAYEIENAGIPIGENNKRSSLIISITSYIEPIRDSALVDSINQYLKV